MKGRSLPSSAYVLASGSLLTPAEAAHLLTREATGEVLPHIPHKTPAGYVLTARAALTLADLEQHLGRVRQVRDFLEPYCYAALTA